ncbi:hypothetical protein DASB73_033740 [Starmerella bacillaris]|uniref:Uncharacterized protein n=1 Tax=Starmerella bacillaris TaxID=1247836 RepID=A0AAV5RLK6_STABA|nr:hypothetical protein DASB73_033740 [Starmerella bacillaris]
MHQKNKEIEELEAQLRIVSQAAAEAIERASRLESELESTKSRSMSRSSSLSSLGSQLHGYTTPDERLGVLENALSAIYRARSELSSPHNFQHV